MQSEQLNRQHPAEAKARLRIKISKVLAEDLLNAYKEQLNEVENPPFKEEFLGDYFEDCVNIAANSAVGEMDAKKEVESLNGRLEEQQNQGNQMKIILYALAGFSLIMVILAIVFYKRYKAYAF